MNALLKKERKRITLLSTEKWKKADYVVVNVTYAIMYDKKKYEYLKEKYSKVDSLKCYNNIVAEVYKKK